MNDATNGPKYFQVTEAETNELIDCAGFGNPINFSFGPSGVFVKNVPENADTIRRLAAIREEANYMRHANEHDF
jgi:hypothetical protein